MSSTAADSHMRDYVAYDRNGSELERRVERLEGLDESIPGRFTRWDWPLCLAGAALVPNG